MRKHLVTFAALLLFFAAAGGQARAGFVVTNLSTGLDASGNLITNPTFLDANWQTYGGGTIGNAPLLNPDGPQWKSTYLADGPNSDWLGPTGTFIRTFDLTGIDLSTVSISGSWTIDGSGTINLNGYTVATLTNGDPGSLTSFSVSGSSGYFNPGVNNLYIITDNYAQDAVRLEGTLTGETSGTTGAAPAPSGLALSVAGSLALAAWGLLRRLTKPGNDS